MQSPGFHVAGRPQGLSSCDICSCALQLTPEPQTRGSESMTKEYFWLCLESVTAVTPDEKSSNGLNAFRLWDSRILLFRR